MSICHPGLQELHSAGHPGLENHSGRESGDDSRFDPFLKEKGMEVFYDAEHFFDGYKATREYALKCLRTAVEAGAASLVLCDTNGGALPEDVAEAVKAACKVAGGVQVGMHAHNDSGLGIANTMAAVKAGATQVQGTINGYGERCGNANLCVIIPNIKLKMGIDCITDQQLVQIDRSSPLYQ